MHHRLCVHLNEPEEKEIDFFNRLCRREEVAKKVEQQADKKQDEQIELDSLDSSINRRTTSSILSFNCSGKRSTSKKRKSRKEG